MLLSAVSVLVVAQSSSEIPEGLTNNPVLCFSVRCHFTLVRVAYSWQPPLPSVCLSIVMSQRVWRYLRCVYIH